MLFGHAFDLVVRLEEKADKTKLELKELQVRLLINCTSYQIICLNLYLVLTYLLFIGTGTSGAARI